MHPLQTQIPTTLVMLALAALLFYFMIIRPARRQMAAQKTRQEELREATHPGVRVMLASGLVGTVQHVGERQVILELAPGVEVTVLKDAISKIMTPEDEDFEYDDSDDADLAEDSFEGSNDEGPNYEGSAWAADDRPLAGAVQSPGSDDDQFAPVIDTEPAQPVERPEFDEPVRDADRRN